MAPAHLASLAILLVHCLLLAGQLSPATAFSPAPHRIPCTHHHMSHISHRRVSLLLSSPEDNNNLGVIDLTDDEDDAPLTAQEASNDSANSPAAPFLSQGELSDDPNLLNPDFSDAKQTRVIVYIILTLLPILFLVPLMIGSRDLIPLDALPPVEMQ